MPATRVMMSAPSAYSAEFVIQVVIAPSWKPNNRLQLVENSSALPGANGLPTIRPRADLVVASSSQTSGMAKNSTKTVTMRVTIVRPHQPLTPGRRDERAPVSRSVIGSVPLEQAAARHEDG